MQTRAYADDVGPTDGVTTQSTSSYERGTRNPVITATTCGHPMPPTQLLSDRLLPF